MKKCKAIFFFFFLPFVPFHVILHTLVPETVAGFIDRHLFPPAESETSHWKQATPGKNKWPAHRKWGTETKTWIGHSWLKREGKKRMESWEGKWCGLDCRDWKIVLILFKSFFLKGSGYVVHRERCRFGDRVFWVRSTQAMCASAAGAGPAVPKSEDFPMDTDSPDSSDNEVSPC